MNVRLAFIHDLLHGHRRAPARGVALALALAVAGCGSPTSTVRFGPSGGPSAPVDSTASLAPTTKVSAFFYLWYGTSAHDGAWRHWNQNGHSPPDDIASAFYPARGPYSSRDPSVLAAQMADLHAAGVGVAVLSWWGRGGWEDQDLAPVFAAARAAGVQLAFHIEPYAGRTPESLVADIRDLLGRFGGDPALFRIARPTAASGTSSARPVFYVFNSAALPQADLRTALAALRGTPDDPIVLVQSPRIVSATRVGADGIYTYDTLGVTPERFASIVADCRAANLLCSPSVGPGFDSREAVAGGLFADRASGARYDASWQAAIGAGAEWVSVVSYNEWHEGTQIEPARDFAAGGRTYTGYEGAYGATGAGAPDAYLRRTAHWVAVFEGAG